MLLGWFSRKSTSTAKSAEKAMRTLDRIFSRIRAFAAERRPNLYQKTCFGNRIKWVLGDGN